MNQNHFPMMSFSRFVFYCNPLICWEPEYKEKEKGHNAHFLFMKIESCQYLSPQNSTRYTKVMNIFHIFTHLNDTKI